MLPIMSALCKILNSAYYANNYAGIFDTGLIPTNDSFSQNNTNSFQRFTLKTITKTSQILVIWLLP